MTSREDEYDYLFKGEWVSTFTMTLSVCWSHDDFDLSRVQHLAGLNAFDVIAASARCQTHGWSVATV